jgi:hypothetical protein
MKKFWLYLLCLFVYFIFFGVIIYTMMYTNVYRDSVVSLLPLWIAFLDSIQSFQTTYLLPIFKLLMQLWTLLYKVMCFIIQIGHNLTEYFTIGSSKGYDIDLNDDVVGWTFSLADLCPLFFKIWGKFSITSALCWFGLNQITIYAIKLTLCLMFLIVIRGCVPRYRYDALSKLGWVKFLVEILKYVIIIVVLYLLFF